MKPQVPDILVKFYRKHDPAAQQHKIDTSDLPELETLYRDNTTGIVWKVIARSGGDVYRPTYDPNFWAEAVSLRKQDQKRDRMVILQSVEPEGVAMHITPDVLKSRMHSSAHYAVIVKATPDIERFTKLDFLESGDAPFWKRGVKTMDTEKTLRKLAEAETTSLYVLNIYATKHGLADLLIEYLDENSAARKSQVANVHATWLPQDLLKLIPKDALLKSQTFRRYLDGGFIQPITTGSAKRIMATPEYEKEVERMNQCSPRYQHPVDLLTKGPL